MGVSEEERTKLDWALLELDDGDDSNGGVLLDRQRQAALSPRFASVIEYEEPRAKRVPDRPVPQAPRSPRPVGSPRPAGDASFDSPRVSPRPLPARVDSPKISPRPVPDLANRERSSSTVSSPKVSPRPNGRSSTVAEKPSPRFLDMPPTLQEKDLSLSTSTSGTLSQQDGSSQPTSPRKK